MKKITPILAGLLLSTVCSANQHDLSEKMYVGVSVGGSFPTISTTAKEFQNATSSAFIKNNLSAYVHGGIRFGELGVQITAGWVEQLKFAIPNGALSAKVTDYMLALDLGYYAQTSDLMAISGSVGLAGFITQNSITVAGGYSLPALSSSMLNAGFSASDKIMGYTPSSIKDLYVGRNNNSQLKIAPKLGLGLQYAVNSEVSVTSNVNLIYPIKADHIKYLINLNIGVNYHF